MPMTMKQFAADRHSKFERNVTATIRALIQDKHLYQSVRMQSTDSYVSIKSDKTKVTERLPLVTEAVRAEWTLEAASPRANLIHVKVPDVKVFCLSCRRIEAYNSVFAVELFSKIQIRDKHERETQQMFLFAYQCQSCKRLPEIFLIRRRGLKLTNEGRSPIEHVEVPVFIPNVVQKFFGGGIVAHQSGQTLAGLFLLRTVLEQWARAASGSKKEQADQVMDDYMATLPEDFKNRFPSMRTLYGELSADIHNATGSADLFEKARDEIVQHFDGRRVFSLAK